MSMDFGTYINVHRYLYVIQLRYIVSQCKGVWDEFGYVCILSILGLLIYMYIYIYIYMPILCICMYMDLHINIQSYVYMFLCVCMCKYKFSCVCAYVYECRCIFVCVHVLIGSLSLRLSTLECRIECISQVVLECARGLGTKGFARVHHMVKLAH